MATKTETAAKATVKKASPAKKAAPAEKPAATTPALKPLKDTFTRTSPMSHLAEQAAVDAKAVKAVLLHLEDTIVASLHKKGASEFALLDLFKVMSVKVPATKRRFDENPLTGVDQWLKTKPATVRIKVRALKKVKDAAINS